MSVLRITCGRIGCENPPASGQKYCSRDCAPLGRFGSSQNTSRSTRKVESISAQPGGTSAPYKEEENKTASAGFDTKTILTFGKESSPTIGLTGTATKKDSTKSTASGTEQSLWKKESDSPKSDWSSSEAIQNESGEPGESGISETETSTALTKSNDATHVSQLEDSFSPANDIAVEKSNSMHLLDSTAEHLHGLMKGIAKEDGHRLKDPRVVMAAATCAKNIHSLLRLKFDVIKELRK